MRPEDDKAAYLESGPKDGRDGLERLDQVRSILAEGATWSEPPPRVLEGVLGALGVASPPASDPVPKEVRWPAIVASVGAMAAVVALVLSTVFVLSARPADSEIQLASTALAPGVSGVATVRPTGSGWWIRLDLSGLPPAPDGAYYEGWVWSEDGEGVSIGTFHMRDGVEPVILWSGVELGDYPLLTVTLEREGEGPAASDRVMLEGRLGALPG